MESWRVIDISLERPLQPREPETWRGRGKGASETTFVQMGAPSALGALL